ncbi:MAG: glycosyltransferase family 2 protein [Betaproteobacteria bacterium]
MFVSFVVPVFNTGTYLAEAVDSLRQQTGFDREAEILLVDDCSSDPATLALLRQFDGEPGLRVIRQPRNAGPAVARNAGIRAAKGAWIAFLDADDLLLPDAMARRLAVIERHPEAVWLAGKLRVMPRLGEIEDNTDFANAQELGKTLEPGVVHLVRPTRTLIHWPMPPHVGSAMVRRDALEAAGLFDETLIFGEDWYFWLRLSLAADLYWLEAPTMVLRRHHESMMKNTLNLARKVTKASRRAFFDPAFRHVRKDLRWKLASDYRWASRLFAAAGHRLPAVRTALLAVLATPNSAQSLKALTVAWRAPSR